MVLLADKASDDGTGIYASKQTMADELCWSKRVIQQTIAGLVADGLLIIVGERACDRGHTVEYAIDVDRLECLPLVACHAKKEAAKAKKEEAKRAPRGERHSPVNDMHGCTTLIPRGERGAPKPSMEPIITSPTPLAGGRSAAGRIPKEPIREDWNAPSAEDLPVEIAALARQWPNGAYAAEARAFHQHWRGTGRKQADWAARWAARVQERHGEVMRQGERGVKFAAELTGAARRPARPSAPVPEKSAESARSTALHLALAEVIGRDLWRLWFEPAALIVNDDTVTVVAPSQFASEWIEANQAGALSKAASKCGWHVKLFRHRVTAPVRQRMGRKGNEPNPAAQSRHGPELAQETFA